MTRMLVIVPTRGRPGSAARLRRAVLDTSAEAHVIFCVDADDPSEYEKAVPPSYLLRGAPARLGPWLNLVAPEMVDRYDVIGFMGDDHLPETMGWDLSVLAVLDAAGPFGVAYGNDGYQGEKLPTAVFMRSELIQHLGWMVPPGLEHLYIDNAWKDLGLATGSLRYLPDVKITHLHPAAGLSDNDATYKAGNSKQQYAKDRRTYHQWKHRVLPGLFPNSQFPETPA